MKNGKPLHPIITYKVPSLSRMLREANQDSDAASFYWLHDDHRCRNWKDTLDLVTRGELSADGAIIIIKGPVAARAAWSFLCKEGLCTPGKPVIDPKEAA